jgi:hypothetical protein
MKWIGNRISFVDEKLKTTIVIRPETSIWIQAIMGAWVAMWMVIGGTVIWSIFTMMLSNQEKIILYVFLSFWFYYAFRVMRSFLWLRWGKELLKIDEVALFYKKSIKSYGSSKPYYFENIKKISLDIPKERSLQIAWESSPWIRGGERISFEYMGKVIKIGQKLNEKDAKLLFQLVTKKIEEKLKKRKD